VNGEIIALALPVNLCLVWALTRLLPQWQLDKPNPSVSASLTGNRQQSNFP
jgi:hypothetical protein